MTTASFARTPYTISWHANHMWQCDSHTFTISMQCFSSENILIEVEYFVQTRSLPRATQLPVCSINATVFWSNSTRRFYHCHKFRIELIAVKNTTSSRFLLRLSSPPPPPPPLTLIFGSKGHFSQNLLCLNSISHDDLLFATIRNGIHNKHKSSNSTAIAEQTEIRELYWTHSGFTEVRHRLICDFVFIFFVFELIPIKPYGSSSLLRMHKLDRSSITDIVVWPNVHTHTAIHLHALASVHHTMHWMESKWK